MKWKTIACSAKGTSHIHRDMPCQDYGHYVCVNDVIIGAVADGAGSAKHSDIGAKLAVETALKYLEKFIKEPDWGQTLLEKGAKTVFAETLKTVVDALRKEADSKEYSLNDLACTLLVFVATPKWIAAMQIGDGFIVVRPENKTEYQLLFPPDKGEYANETTFVTSADALAQIQSRVSVLSDNQKFICASTDGLERLAINIRELKAYTGFFKPFEDGLQITSNLDEEAKDIHKWMESEDVNERTDDDKTLLLCLFEVKELQINDEQKQVINSQYLENDIPRKDSTVSPRVSAIPLSFMAVSYTCHVLAGCLFSITFTKFTKLNNYIALLVCIALAVAIVLSVSTMTFIKLMKWFRKRQNVKEINFKNIKFGKLIKFLTKIRLVIILTLASGTFGLFLGWLLYLPLAHFFK